MSLDAKRARLRHIIGERSFLKGTFTLASGRTSRYYIDMKPTLLHPEGNALVSELMLDAVAGDRLSLVGGPAYGAIPIVVGMVQKSFGSATPLDGFYIRKEQKERGTEKLIDGMVEAGARAAIVEDVTTTAGSALRSVAIAREAGLEIVKVLTVVDRLEGAQQALAAEGLELVSLLTIKDLDD